MAITAKQVNELRQITGAGMMDCKKALVEADGDIEKAIDILRKKGQKIAAKRADRETSEGKVFAYTSPDGTEGIAFTFNCETEPVSNTDDFISLGQKVLEAAIANKPSSAEELAAIKAGDDTLADQITALTGKIGEKIEIGSYAYLKGEKVVSYLHGKSIAVLVVLDGGNDDATEAAGRDVAMQIAAMNPVGVDENSVPAEVVEREKQLGIDKAREEGKPENILEKIAEGYVKKFFKENTLLSQPFVKDNKVTVQQYLTSVKSGLTVSGFSRLSIGR